MKKQKVCCLQLQLLSQVWTRAETLKSPKQNQKRRFQSPNFNFLLVVSMIIHLRRINPLEFRSPNRSPLGLFSTLLQNPSPHPKTQTQALVLTQYSQGKFSNLVSLPAKTSPLHSPTVASAPLTHSLFSTRSRGGLMSKKWEASSVRIGLILKLVQWPLQKWKVSPWSCPTWD